LCFWGGVTNVRAQAARLGDLDIDVEDYAALALTHANGVRSEIHLDYLQRSKRRGCEIVGTEGTLVWTSEGKSPETCSVRFRPPGNGAWEVILEDANLDASGAYMELMRRFLEPRANGSDLLDGWGGAEGLAIALAARRAAQSGSATSPAAVR
jgi:predicted dehydrogenase